MKIMLGCVILFLSALFSGISLAGTFSCSGHVKTVAIGPLTGVLQVDTGYGVHYLCKFQGTYNGVAPEVCRAWYSMFLSAQATSSVITQYYSDSAGTTCSTLGNWAVPNPMPYYVEVTKK